MSDPNSKSSDILSDGPVKDILRPALPTLAPNVRDYIISLTLLHFSGLACGLALQHASSSSYPRSLWYQVERKYRDY
jgi:hypothetical protein